MDTLATYLAELPLNLEEVGPMSQVSLSKWFDSAGVTLAEDELTNVCYEAGTYYNAYVRRVT